MIPDYQKCMLPFLESLGSGEEKPQKVIREEIADNFNLNEEERRELLPSGTQAIFNNRVGWARTYLEKAGLIKSPKRGVHQITDEGKNILSQNLKSIDSSVLKQYPSFTSWSKISSSGKEEVDINQNESDSMSPEELLESTYQNLKRTLANELLDKIKANHPDFFEKLVVDLLLSMGYGGSRKDAGEVRGKTGDGGIDGLIKEDKLGLDRIYIQAKRYENTVPVSHIRDFAGSLLAHKAKKGIFMTTSDFPKSAEQFVKDVEHRIILINGDELSNLMIEYEVGVTAKTNYTLYSIDSDYFEESL